MQYSETDAFFSPDHKFRFTLTRIWDQQKPVALVAMLNPSNANYVKDDPTIRRLTELLNSIGYGGYVVVNWSPFISSRPRAMLEYMNTPTAAQIKVLEKNNTIINKLARSHDTHIVAWGNQFPKNLAVGKFLSGYTSDFMHNMSGGYRNDLKCFGMTKSGAPKHPLARGRSRIANRTLLQSWIGTDK